MDSLSQIPGLGPKTLEKLSKLKILQPFDLLYHFPHRYLDFSRTTPISQVKEFENITITGKIINFNNIFTRNGKNLQKATVADSTGRINLIWFNQPYLSKNILVGQTYSFAGTVSRYLHQLTIIAPEYGQYNTGKIIPIYPETSGLTSRWFRKTINSHLVSLCASITDPLPSKIISKYRLLPLKTALSQIHFPSNPSLLKQARLRLSLDEILALQYRSHLEKSKWLSRKPKFILSLKPQFAAKISSFIKTLPFQLTSAQKKAWREILADLISTQKTTNRLLQGDVGSGKTIVIALAAYLNYLNKHLTVLLCPTEILAHQHFTSFQKFFPRLPIKLLTANTKPDKIPKNSIVIATHAAIFKKDIIKKNLGLLLVDEQHKFGVKQRSALLSPANPPHSITLTATPIPRTISLATLGNLDISIIDSLPQNRLPIKTFLVPNHKKLSCYRWIQDQIINTHCQCFIVCPFIQPSETLESVKSATAEFENLSRQVFPNFKLALIHGKNSKKYQQEIVSRFTQNQTHILVTTPIIEVGIDFPNASIIVIQSADRFGLAQLHQLRGRVGRGSSQSYCYLFTESENDKALNRLKFLENHHNGLEIANFDLKTRGPGETFSTLQHGFPSLKIADISDIKLIEFSQKILSDTLHSYPSTKITTLTSRQPNNHQVITN